MAFPTQKLFLLAHLLFVCFYSSPISLGQETIDQYIRNNPQFTLLERSFFSIAIQQDIKDKETRSFLAFDELVYVDGKRFIGGDCRVEYARHLDSLEGSVWIIDDGRETRNGYSPKKIFVIVEDKITAQAWFDVSGSLGAIEHRLGPNHQDRFDVRFEIHSFSRLNDKSKKEDFGWRNKYHFSILVTASQIEIEDLSGK